MIKQGNDVLGYTRLKCPATCWKIGGLFCAYYEKRRTEKEKGWARTLRNNDIVKACKHSRVHVSRQWRVWEKLPRMRSEGSRLNTDTTSIYSPGKPFPAAVPCDREEPTDKTKEPLLSKKFLIDVKEVRCNFAILFSLRSDEPIFRRLSFDHVRKCCHGLAWTVLSRGPHKVLQLTFSKVVRDRSQFFENILSFNKTFIHDIRNNLVKFSRKSNNIHFFFIKWNMNLYELETFGTK